MRVKDIKDECFQDYHKTHMLICTIDCDWKCFSRGEKNICQNSHLVKQPTIYIDNKELFNRYINNPISKSIVVGGLEPFKQYNELLSLITCFRINGCLDDIIIYTGYTEEELEKEIKRLQLYKNIIIKFGRYIPNNKSIFDKVLGVELASSNQYAKRIS